MYDQSTFNFDESEVKTSVSSVITGRRRVFSANYNYWRAAVTTTTPTTTYLLVLCTPPTTTIYSLRTTVSHRLCGVIHSVSFPFQSVTAESADILSEMTWRASHWAGALITE
ncbi:hypothetical protein VTO42DRAFT_5769 [Malbranchea cinnamomea]